MKKIQINHQMKSKVKKNQKKSKSKKNPKKKNQKKNLMEKSPQKRKVMSLLLIIMVVEIFII